MEIKTTIAPVRSKGAPALKKNMRCKCGVDLFFESQFGWTNELRNQAAMISFPPTLSISPVPDQVPDTKGDTAH